MVEGLFFGVKGGINLLYNIFFFFSLREEDLSRTLFQRGLGGISFFPEIGIAKRPGGGELFLW